MGTTAQKLAYTATSVNDIQAAIIEKGVAVPSTVPLGDYGNKIREISTGIVPTGNIELQQQTGTNVTQYATASVKSGTAGTPVATKGSVSGHSITITPSVNNTAAGWINAGTLTGTAVSVAASELVSGSITLTQATSTDVTNYASATVKTGSVNTPATTKQQSTPTITVSSAGLVTANVAATSVSVTPNVGTAGWVSSGTAGTITMSASSATLQLSTQAAATITPTTSAQTAVAAGKYTTGAVTVAAIQTETKTALANGTVTPTSGKYLSSVDVAVPLPAGCKWYGTRSWTAASLASNMFLQNETWTNSQGTTGIVTGDIIALEVTVTDKSNRVWYMLIKVTSMSGTTAIGDGIGAVEKYKEASPTLSENIYRTGTGTPSSTLGNNGDVYFDLS